MSLVRRCLTLCLMIYEILQSAHRPSDSRWILIFSLPISVFSALGVSHVMRSINVRYFTYLLFSKLCSCTTPAKTHARTLEYSGLITCTTNEQFCLFQSVIFFSFDFDLIAIIVMSFCVSMPHFTNIGSLAAEIMTSCRYSRWRPLWHNFTFVSHFWEGQCLSAYDISSG